MFGESKGESTKEKTSNKIVCFSIAAVSIPFTLLNNAGNTEQGKCRLMIEYPFLLFLIGHWYYEKNILYL